MKLSDAQVDAINDAARDVEIEPTAYSGRAMYGQHCLGLPADDMCDVARFFVSLATIDDDLADMLAQNLRTDSLGLGIVAYFPRFESEGHWSDEDEDDDGEI